MSMDICIVCGTKITTLRKEWIHLIDGNDNHKPEPKDHKPKDKKK